MKEQKYDNFDFCAKNYRQEHTKNIQKISGVDSNYFSEYKVQEVLRCEGNNQNSVILDFGCGDGNSASYFVKYLLPIMYYGIDISNNSIEIAKHIKLDGCIFKIFDGEVIPFKDDTFDIIFIAGVLHHINNSYHERILNECKRVLKEGGRLYIFEHNPYNPLTRKIVQDCQFDIDADLIASSKINNILQILGFRNIIRRYTIFFPRKCIFVLLERLLHWCPLGGQYYFRCIK